MNDDFFVDFENMQMLWCIVCKLQKTSGIVLSQSYILRNNLTKYNKINGIIPMKTHVDIAHPKLFALRKTQLAKKATIVNANHTWQKGKKRTRASSFTITLILGPQTHAK